MAVWTGMDDVFAAIQAERNQTTSYPTAVEKKKKKKNNRYSIIQGYLVEA